MVNYITPPILKRHLCFYPSESLQEEQFAANTVTLKLLMDGRVVEFVRTERNIRGGGRKLARRCGNQGIGGGRRRRRSLVDRGRGGVRRHLQGAASL